MLQKIVPRVATSKHPSLRIITKFTTRNMTSSPFSQAVVSAMRSLYPEALADKSFDNTGLLLEAPFLPVRRNRNSVLLTNDLTRAVADEAIQNNHSVVVSYHPIIFRGLKALTLEDSQQQSLLKLAANGISVYSPHTAVDTVPGGMADWLCDIVTGKLDAPEPETFTADQSPMSETDVTTSEDDSDANISSKPTTPPVDQEETSDPFTTPTPKIKPKRPTSLAHRTYSKPTYPRPSSTFHPAVLSHLRKVVTPSPQSALDSANALNSTTSYDNSNTGAGRVITFTDAQPLTLLISRIAHAIGLPKGFPVAIPQFSMVESLMITTVGVCPGSGAGVLRNCNPPPDLIFTGEMSHHDALAVTERGGCVVTLFHSNSERGYLWGPMKEKLEAKVREEWENLRLETKKQAGEWADGVEEILEDESVEICVSEADRDPFGIVILQESQLQGIEI